jgi:hypothetical protein
MKNHQEEATVGTDAFLAFVQQFGQDDIYNRIIIEETLKVIMGIKEEEKNGDSTY